MTKRRGAVYAGNAAAFVAVVTVLIILYILFLPPDIRSELLGDPNAIINGTDGTSPNTHVLLKQNVGTVTYINTNEKTYDLPAIRIYSPTSGQVLKNIPTMSLRYALFDTQNSEQTIDLDLDRAATKNVLLSFNVREGKGPLIIKVNGREIYNAYVDSANPKPIALDHGYLLDTNTVTFSVPSIGLAFWRANKYKLENIQITGDVTDYSNSLAVQNFVITQIEKDNMESIKLFFYPGCDLSEVGALRIDLNGRSIYNGVADCGTRTFTPLNVNDLLVGTNELRFYSTRGSYLLDNIYIKTTMNKPAYKTYYFDIDQDYFNVRSTKATCGEYDNICPSGCDETLDADCCFERSGYWCSLPTLNSNDRCRFYVSSTDCNICKTGYYDKNDDSPDACEDTCGDNNDDKCLGNCPVPNRYYDQDCCYAQNADNYWCQETPITGIDDKCKPSISPGECDLCPSGYRSKDGERPQSCTYGSEFYQEEYELSANYELKLIVRFTDSKERKRVDIDVNGHTFRIDTTGIEYSKIINDFARIDTNSIQIIPVSDDVQIAELRVELRQVADTY